MCEGEGGVAIVNLASLPVVQAIGAYVEIGGKAYSTGPERGEGEPFTVGQAFGEDDDIMIDFVDPNFEAILASLRVTFIGGEDDLWTGMLRSGETVVDVTCTAG